MKSDVSSVTKVPVSSPTISYSWIRNDLMTLRANRSVAPKLRGNRFGPFLAALRWSDRRPWTSTSCGTRIGNHRLRYCLPAKKKEGSLPGGDPIERVGECSPRTISETRHPFCGSGLRMGALMKSKKVSSGLYAAASEAALPLPSVASSSAAAAGFLPAISAPARSQSSRS